MPKADIGTELYAAIFLQNELIEASVRLVPKADILEGLRDVRVPLETGIRHAL